MSLRRTNPLTIEVLGEGDLGPIDLEQDIQELHERVKEADDTRSDWVAKQERLLRQRKGIRRPKSFPWPGANNSSWPLTDKVIRRWKPGMTSLVLNADPVTYFFPVNPQAIDAAPMAQNFYHWAFFQIHNVYESVHELVDMVGQFGLAYTRQGWDYKTDQVSRIVRADSLFPGGIEQATAQFNQTIAQLPQAPGQEPQFLSETEFVTQRLKQEYGLDERNPREAQVLAQATQRLIQGAPYIKLVYQTILRDHLSLGVVSPLDVIMPARTPDPAEADFLAIVHRQMSLDVMRKMARDGHFDPNQVERVGEKMSSRVRGEEDDISGSSIGLANIGRGGIRDVLDKLEGVQPAKATEPDFEILIECYCMMDLNGDGLLERAVVWYHPSTLIVLAIFQYPYPFTEWPVVRFEFEKASKRPLQSRGIAELLTTFQKEKNRLHNARLDAIQVTLAPIYAMRNTAGMPRRNIRAMPGAIISVAQVGDFAKVDNSGPELLGFLQEENKTDRDAEDYVGIFDPGVLAANAQERRTATEVEAVTSQVQQIFQGDSGLFQNSMAKVHQQLWKLWLDLGPEEIFIRVTGEEQPIRVRKGDIAFEFDIVPAGTPSNTNKLLAQQRAMQMLQFFIGDQTGLIDKHRLFKTFLDTIDHNLGKLMLRSPEEAALIQQVQGLVSQINQQPTETP